MVKHEQLTRWEHRQRRTFDRAEYETQSRKITTYKELKVHSILGGAIKWYTLLKEYEVKGEWK